MAIYTPQSITGYNDTPPSDDGAEVASNQGLWATVKSKLNDPIKTLAEAIDTQLQTAFGKVAMELISNGTVSSASSLDITDLTTEYRGYILYYDGLVPASDTASLHLLVSDDNGATFKTGASDYAYTFAFQNDNAVISRNADPDDTEILLATLLGATSDEAASGTLWIDNPMNSSYRTMFRHNYAQLSSSDLFQSGYGTAQYQTAAAIDAIRIIPSTGNIANMNYSFYGIHAS